MVVKTVRKMEKPIDSSNNEGSVQSPVKGLQAKLFQFFKNRNVLAMLGILALGGILRLWNLHHLFNAVHDSDEGIYSIGARFMSEGFLPYQDFILTHPPLFNLILSGIYDIFGYDFFYGKYLAVALSLASIILIYLIGKKLFHPTAGLIAAALFAVSPEMVYVGRRVVQEPMGIFLIILAIYFACNYIKNNKVSWSLLFCGLALGLAVTTKYTFIPAVVAIVLAITLLSLDKRLWQSIKILGKPTFWVSYLSLVALFYGLLLIPRLTFNTTIPLPFFDTVSISAYTMAISSIVFILPLIGALVIHNTDFPFRQWFTGIWNLRRNRGILLLLAGTGLGFIAITGYFLITMPGEFVNQTLLMQSGRIGAVFPSLTAFIREALSASGFLKASFLPVLLSIPVIFIILRRQNFSRRYFFLSAAMITGLVLCQGLYGLPRYYISLFPFLLLGIVSLLPPLDIKMFTARLGSISSESRSIVLVPFAAIILFISLSMAVLANYPSYDTNSQLFASKEEAVYQETVDYLETARAQKVYAVNPIFLALSEELESTLAFESFALLWLAEKPASEIVQNLIDEGVDYIVLDAWVRYWGKPYSIQIDEFVNEVRQNYTLVKIIAGNTLIWTEIYSLDLDTVYTYD